MTTNSEEPRTIDLERIRRGAFGPWLPNDHEEHKLKLETLIRFAETALSVLELPKDGKRAWARQDLDHPTMREAVDALGGLPPDGYRIALEVVESEVRDLIASSPRNPSR